MIETILYGVGSTIIPACLGYMYVSSKNQERKQMELWAREKTTGRPDLIVQLSLATFVGEWELLPDLMESQEEDIVMQKKHNGYAFRVRKCPSGEMTLSCLYHEKPLYEFSRKANRSISLTQVKVASAENSDIAKSTEKEAILYHLFFEEAEKAIDKWKQGRLITAGREPYSVRVSAQQFLVSYRKPMATFNEIDVDAILSSISSFMNTDESKVQNVLSALPNGRKMLYQLGDHCLHLYRYNGKFAVVMMNERGEWFAKASYDTRNRSGHTQMYIPNSNVRSRWEELVKFCLTYCVWDEEHQAETSFVKIKEERSEGTMVIDKLQRSMTNFLEQERKWMTQEEIHLFSHTYSEDLTELRALYEEEEERLPEKASELLAQAEEAIQGKMQKIMNDVAQRKVRKVEEKVRVISER